jgi:acyl-CoA synthetase (AMP-forming)/AMP-acid ligase II
LRVAGPLIHPLRFAESHPDKPAIVWADDGRRLTYAELGRAMRRGARLLRACGLARGDGIVVLAENRIETFGIFWAAQLAGLYYTAVSTQFQRAEIEHILRDCDAKLLVVSDAQLAKLRDIDVPQPHCFVVGDSPPGYVSWRDATAAQPDVLIDDASEGAEMLYSSGTTGQPKGVRHTMPGAPLGTTSELFKRRVALHSLDERTVYLSTAPLYHSAPLRYTSMVNRLGGTAVILAKFDPVAALAAIETYRVTHSQWVPTMFVRLLRLPEAERRRFDLASHRFAIHAAAPCPIDVKRRMLDWWGPILYEYYSGTEGNGQTAITPHEWLAHPGSVGRPILGALHILDDAGRELGPGETGTVYFEGGPAFEYYKDAEKTRRSRSREGWSTLGDIGHVDADGYLYLTDRASFMIISGGVNIYPQEVENVLLAHPLVADAAVFGIPHPEFGEEVKVAVELANGVAPDAVIATALIEHCRARLAHYKCPKSIDFHRQLPRHQTGKLYKRELRDAYWKGSEDRLNTPRSTETPTTRAR